MNHKQEIQKLLTEHKAILARRNKHKIWRFPDGKIFVQSSTPNNDWLADRNQLRTLKMVLGVTKTVTPEQADIEAKRKQQIKSINKLGGRPQPLMLGSFRVTEAAEATAFTSSILLGNQLAELWELYEWTNQGMEELEQYNRGPLRVIVWNRLKKRCLTFLRKLQLK